MPLVAVYRFTGLYNGDAEYDYAHPELGEVYSCWLLMAQDDDKADYPRALLECQKYGFADVALAGYNILTLAALASDQYRGFQDYHDEALRLGSSLVCFPGGEADLDD